MLSASAVAACASSLKASGQLKDQQERVLDSAQLVMRQMSGSLTERAGVDSANHLAEDLRWLVLDRDIWMKAG